MSGIDAFVNGLGEGWTIYIWLISGVLIVVAAMIAMRWAYKNKQFDEDIKYVVFDEGDKDRMDPEEYKKSREVMAEQMRLREEFLEKERQEREQRHQKKG
ncbi:MAG TPA: hypothetical protein VJ961_04485 [Mariprofundaceae bacterium]|nr:hypothetical protein [Mariprofundaceae bacterium]